MLPNMTRQARIVVPGVAHHVTQRGNNRQDIFFLDGDRRAYLGYLKESAARFGLKVWGYCLMTNHVHLVAVPETEDSLAKALGRAHLMYAQYIHRPHGRLGHFWQGRFYSCALDEQHAEAALAYVELNPVRAGMVRVPWTYPWSSAGSHCRMRGDASGLLDLREWEYHTPPAEWKATLRELREAQGEIDRLRLHTRTGRPLGSDSFFAKIETVLGLRLPIRGRGRPKGSKDRAKHSRHKTP